MKHVTFLFSVIVSTGVLTHAGDIKVAVLPDWWQYIPRFVSGQKVSSLQFTNLTSESNETQYDKIIEVISYLNESHSDVVFGPCRRDISIAVEGLRMPYICTTFDPEVEVFKFKILPALSDFIEAMRKLVYGQYRRGGEEEYKTIIYEGNKGFHFDDNILNHRKTTRLYAVNEENMEAKKTYNHTLLDAHAQRTYSRHYRYM